MKAPTRNSHQQSIIDRAEAFVESKACPADSMTEAKRLSRKLETALQSANDTERQNAKMTIRMWA